MTDEFDRLLEGSLAARAEGAPACGGVTDVRRRVRRRRQRRSALTALPVLVGAGAGVVWVRSSDQPGVASGGTDVSSTTDGSFATTTSIVEAGSGFRCLAETMTAFDNLGWSFFESCEPWELSGTTPVSTSTTLLVITPWEGSSTQDVLFLNASTTGGVAPIVAGVHFGAGESLVSPINSATSFVMYADEADASFAEEIAASIGISARFGIDERYLPVDAQPAPSIAVVVGDDIAAQLNSGGDPVEPSVPSAGVPMRCWEPSKAVGADDSYRYFQTCENTADITGTTTGDSSTDISLPTLGTTTTTMLVTNGCQRGQYMIDETDTSRQMVAEKFDITVEQMDAANTETPGYNAFYPGLVITIPCPPES